MLKTHRIPDPAKGPVTAEEVQAMIDARIIPSGFKAFSSWSAAFVAGGMAVSPNVDASKKLKHWSYSKGVTILRLQQNDDGSWDKLDMQQSGFSDATTMAALGEGTVQFLSSYCRPPVSDQRLRFIPKLELLYLQNSEAREMNYAFVGTPYPYPQGAVPYPLGYVFDDQTKQPFRSSLNDIGFWFSPTTGEPEWFYIQDYMSEYPIVNSATVSGGGSPAARPYRIANVDLPNAVMPLFMDSNLNQEQRGARIRALAEEKA